MVNNIEDRTEESPQQNLSIILAPNNGHITKFSMNDAPWTDSIHQCYKNRVWVAFDIHRMRV